MEQKKMTIDALMEQGKATGKLTTKEITDVLTNWTSTPISSPPLSAAVNS